MTKLETKVAEMNAAVNKMNTLMKINAKEDRIAAILAASHGREALQTLQRLGIDLPGSGYVEAAAVDRAMASASMSTSRRMEVKALLGSMGILR